MKKLVFNALLVGLFASSLCALSVYAHETASEKKEKRERKKREKEAKQKERAAHKKEAHKKRCEERKKAQAQRKKRLLEIERKERKRLTDMKVDRKERRELAARWKDFRQVEDRHDHELGRYADLYKQPARPTYASLIHPVYNPGAAKYNFNPSIEYNYAVDSYLSRGERGNITKLAFGGGDVQIQDLLLVSKLAAADIVTVNDGITNNATPPAFANFDGKGVEYLKNLADAKVRFLGKAESWTLNLDLCRFIWNRYVVFGAQMPVVYKHNHLRAQMDQTSVLKQIIPGAIDGGALANQTNAFLARYGQNTGLFIDDIMRAKGITELGGSSTGLGDITVFGYAVIDEPRLDHLIVGLRFLVPTAQKATTGKLWAPELGNGGYLEGTVFSSIGMYRNWYLNPHLFLQATFSGLSHVNKRVPKRVLAKNGDSLKSIASFGDRVDLKADVDTFDTTLPNLADNVANFKIHKGPEFNVRVGNMVEEFIFRRAFLDIFYDFRAKLADGVSGLTNDVWNIDIYKNGTQQIEHKAGVEWTYQFEESTRVHFGIDYTFAGRNVPKLFAARWVVTYAF